MNGNVRLWQWVQVAAGLGLLVGSYITGSLFSSGLAIIGIGVGIVSLLSPTPDQRVEKEIESLKEQGIYPAPGQATDEDVRRIIKAGHKFVALRIYREIHGVTPSEALQAIKRLS